MLLNAIHPYTRTVHWASWKQSNDSNCHLAIWKIEQKVAEVPVTKDDQDFWTYTLKSSYVQCSCSYLQDLKKTEFKIKVSAALSAFVKSFAISLFLSVTFFERLQGKLVLQLTISWFFSFKGTETQRIYIYLMD